MDDQELRKRLQLFDDSLAAAEERLVKVDARCGVLESLIETLFETGVHNGHINGPKLIQELQALAKREEGKRGHPHVLRILQSLSRKLPK